MVTVNWSTPPYCRIMCSMASEPPL